MTGLIVEGGASRTYFAVGVMDAMMEHNIPVDYITGASAGIANALNYASKQKGRGLEIARNYVPRKEYSGARHMLSPQNKSIYNIDYVFNTVPNELVPFDYGAFENFEGVAEAAVTNVETGKCEYKKIENPRKGWDIIVASCSLPLMFPICKIDGVKYLDGGVTDSLPFKRAIDTGCDKLIVILSRERSYVKNQGKGELISSLMFRKYPEFAHALRNRSRMYNSQREELFQLEKEGKAFVIAPEDTLGWSRTENNPERLTEIYNKGYEEGKKQAEKLIGYLGGNI